MVKAQDWLNTNYPKGARKDINLDLSNKNLEGELDLTDFTNLRILTVANQYPRNWQGFYDWLNDNIVDINEKGAGKGSIKANKRSEYPGLSGVASFTGFLMNGIELSLGKSRTDYSNSLNVSYEPLLPYDDSKNFFQLASGQGNTFKCGYPGFSILQFPSHQQALNVYEKLLRTWRNSTALNNKLTSLDVSDLAQLTTLNCANNQLKTLNISDCPNLETIIANHNNLSDLNFKSLNPQKLKVLNLHNNQLTTRDLSALAPLVNLETLDLGKDNQVEQINRGLYNQFTGSLQALVNFTKLKKLNISATDINHGLEYLPDSLEEFYCDAYGTITEVKTIESSLAAYGTFAVNEDRLKGVKKWKKANPNLVGNPANPITTPKPTDPVISPTPTDSTTNPLPTNPSSTTPDNSKPGSLPSDLPADWRDKLASITYLNKEISDLKAEKERISNEKDTRIGDLEREIATTTSLKTTLEKEVSELRAKTAYLEGKEQELSKWTSAFLNKTPEQAQADAGKVTFTPEQDEAIKNYLPTKMKLAEWTDKFPTFATAEQALTAYNDLKATIEGWDKSFPKATFSNPEGARTAYDKINEDLQEWKRVLNAQTPQSVSSQLANLTINQKPADYQQNKDKLEKLTTALNNFPELKDQEPEQVKQAIEKLKQDLVQRETDLLGKYYDGILARINAAFGKLKHNTGRDLLTAKYGSKIETILKKELTLANSDGCDSNLSIATSICVTEKAEAWVKQIEAMPLSSAERTTQINDAVDFLNKIEVNWKRTPQLADKNSPFYLPIMDNQADYRAKIIAWQNTSWAKTATTTRTISSSSYSYEITSQDSSQVYQSYTEQNTK